MQITFGGIRLPVQFGGKYPVGSAPLEIRLPETHPKQWSGVLTGISKLTGITPPGGRIIGDADTLDKLWRFLKLPPKEKPAPDFTKERVLFVTQKCDGKALARPRQGDKVVSLWERRRQSREMIPEKLVFDRSADCLEVHVAPMREGRDLAWYVAVIPNGAGYIQEPDKTVCTSRIDEKTILRIVTPES